MDGCPAKGNDPQSFCFKLYLLAARVCHSLVDG